MSERNLEESGERNLERQAAATTSRPIGWRRRKPRERNLGEADVEAHRLEETERSRMEEI